MQIQAINNNYLNNKQNVNFGRFKFSDQESIEYLQGILLKKSQVKEFKKIFNNEALRARLIDVTISKEGNSLLAICKNIDFKQNIFESPLKFLKEITKKFDKIELDNMELSAKIKSFNPSNKTAVRSIASGLL